jgi:hypothetical protein
MAIGNTFGATALSSYGGFWISYAIILTPGFNVIGSYKDPNNLEMALGFYLAGWFIFTTILLLCTLRSTIAFFLLFFFLDMAFLLLMIAKFVPAHYTTINAAGGYFGLFAAFMAWYNALAGIADDRYVENANDIHLEPRLTEIFLAATHSSSSPLRISHGQSRAVRNAASQPRPSAKSSRFPVRRESRIVELSASIVFRINPHFRTRTTTPHIHISTYPHTHIYYRKSDLITIHGSRRSRPYSKG